MAIADPLWRPDSSRCLLPDACRRLALAGVLLLSGDRPAG